MNAGIQGLAADIFKVALVRLDRALEDARLASRLILQVHDEVILEVRPTSSDAIGRARASTSCRRRRPLACRSRSTSPSATPGPTPSERDVASERRDRPARREPHWFEDVADHLGSAYLRYSFTKGTEQEVDFLVDALGLEPGMRVLDVGCGPGRHAHALARRGIEVARRRHRQPLRRPGHAPARRRRDVRALRRPGADLRRRVRRRDLACARARSGSLGGDGDDGAVARRHGAGASGPGGRSCVERVHRLLPGALPRGRRRLRRRHRREPRAHRRCKDEAGDGARRSTSGRRASRPASCACSPRAAGLAVEHLWSVTPGAYAPDRARPSTPRVPAGGRAHVPA